MLHTKIPEIDGLTGFPVKVCTCGKYKPMNATHSKCFWCHGKKPEIVSEAAFNNVYQDALSKISNEYK